RLHLEPFFRRRRMATIATADVRRYVARRQEEGAKNATINRELSLLKRAFALAIADGTLASRPHIPLLREDNVRRGFFEADEFEAVRRRLSPDLADFVSFLYATGWRLCSEAARLRWTNVAFDVGEVRLDPGTTKTGEGRVFPFTADLRAVLERRRAVTRARECELGRVLPHVFTRPDGKPVGSFYKAWATACRAAGVPGRVLHDFRRTAVRNLKPLRPNPLAPWELRVGRLRVFYEVTSDEPALVRVLAVGKKEGSVLRIGGKEIEL